MKTIHKCQMTMSVKDGVGEYFFLCEKPAKFILRTGKVFGDGIFVCGIHGKGKNKEPIKE